jgi:hypothetical protein
MRNDARPIGEEFRDIAEHHSDRERPDRRRSTGAGKDAPRVHEPVNRETLDQPPPGDRSDR